MSAMMAGDSDFSKLIQLLTEEARMDLPDTIIEKLLGKYEYLPQFFHVLIAYKFQRVVDFSQLNVN